MTRMLSSPARSVALAEIDIHDLVFALTWVSIPKNARNSRMWSSTSTSPMRSTTGSWLDRVGSELNYKTITKSVINHVETGRFLLLEKLAFDVLDLCAGKSGGSKGPCHHRQTSRPAVR